MRAFADEWKHLFNGKMVYIILFVPIVVAAMFGYVFKNNQINDASIAVVDLDHSNYSRQLINKLDASQYIDVRYVQENEADPNLFLYNEKFFAVIYLPAGLEENRLKGIQSNIGFYVDNTMGAATGNLRSAVAEVISTENATLAGGSLKAMGLSDSQLTGMTTNMLLQQRLLYNPTNSTLMTSVIGFVNTVMISLIGSAALTIVPRLRVNGKLEGELEHWSNLLMRVLPYALVGCAAFYLSLGVLKQVGGLRFEANVWEISIPFLLFTTTLSLLGMALGWTAATPDKASSRIMLIMLPSFLLSGAQLPTVMLPGPLQTIGNILPLTWQFKFLRGMGFKGGGLQYFIPELGGFLLLLTGLLLVIFILMAREKRKWAESVNTQDTQAAQPATP
ncbi:ABC transporter permease [Paenibacillus kribbensis]|uniref:ABC transporter permease n=1 Tax=Paenibacillus kribbensis TaxID=172713 RepID=UPI002DC0187D|nr:ABC transporter permease [Paenibacillus kribbensis]MEC0237639.1 ABC transporter permease [Paenibacillus kribbensis]